jgi:hypothetical protein
MTNRCHYLNDGTVVFAITIRRAGAWKRPRGQLPFFVYAAMRRSLCLLLRGGALNACSCTACRVLHPCWHSAQVLPGGVR